MCSTYKVHFVYTSSHCLWCFQTCTLATTSSGTGSPSEVRGRGEGVGGGDDDKFDWSTAPERKGSISPDLLPSLFRPKPISPVNIEFDHSKAALGKSVLQNLQILFSQTFTGGSLSMNRAIMTHSVHQTVSYHQGAINLQWLYAVKEENSYVCRSHL